MTRIRKSEQITKHIAIEGLYFTASAGSTNGVVSKIFITNSQPKRDIDQYSPNALGGIEPDRFEDYLEVLTELKLAIKEEGLDLNPGMNEEQETEEAISEVI